MELLEATGTVAFYAFSFLLAYVAINADRFSRYGQEALLAAAALLFTAALMRTLVVLDWIGREQAIMVNSVAAISFVLLGVQLAAIKLVAIRHEERRQ
jgi:hypothetical protein